MQYNDPSPIKHRHLSISTGYVYDNDLIFQSLRLLICTILDKALVNMFRTHRCRNSPLYTAFVIFGLDPHRSSYYDFEPA